MVDTLDTFSETITSYALDTGVQWPFLSVPHWERRASLVQHESFLQTFGVVPFIRSQERDAWERYSSFKQSWLQESYDTQAMTLEDGAFIPHQPLNHRDDDVLDQVQEDKHGSDSLSSSYQHTSPIPAVIHKAWETNATDSEGPYAPLWQLSPPPLPGHASVINMDLLSSPILKPMITSIYDTQYMAISRARCYDRYNNTLLSNFYEQDDDGNDAALKNPHSAIVSPIYDSFDKNERNLRAFSVGVLPWEALFSELLPKEMTGVIAVVENSCGQTMTFSIDGPKATFTGEGDLHEPRFTALHEDTNFTELWSDGNTAEQGGNCLYSMIIYPSTEFRSEFITNRPELFTLLIASICAVTGIAFLIYGYVSRDRQKKMMAIAMGTSAVVASMFPSNVRERVLKEAEERAMENLEEGRMEYQGSTRKREKSRTSANTQSGTATTALLSEDGSAQSRVASTMRVHHSRPIADTFPDVTVM